MARKAGGEPGACERTTLKFHFCSRQKKKNFQVKYHVLTYICDGLNGILLPNLHTDVLSRSTSEYECVKKGSLKRPLRLAEVMGVAFN